MKRILWWLNKALLGSYKCCVDNHRPTDNKFCQNCGKKAVLLSDKSCPRCNEYMQFDDKFCGNCGLSKKIIYKILDAKNEYILRKVRKNAKR